MIRASGEAAERATDKLIGAPALPKRALTLRHPWAWMVASGHKDVENRPAKFSHKSFRGEFWIHAGLHDEYETFKVADTLAKTFGFTIPPLTSLDYGCIIGRATIYDIIPPGPSGMAWHFPDQWGFRVRAAQLVKPVKCRGFQGFWSVPDDVLAELGRAV